MRRDLLRKTYYALAPIFPLLRPLKAWYAHRLEPKRYRRLFEVVREVRARRIMEIGTWNGMRAFQMIEEAKKHFPASDVEYYGFDLFELLDEKTFDEEMSKKPPAMAEVEKYLRLTGAHIKLYRGNTRDILPKIVPTLPQMDFIFIDGGHSLETIANDWQYARELMHERTVVMFDDYWEGRDDGGCKKIIEGIDRDRFTVTVLPIRDAFKSSRGIFVIHFVEVRKTNI